MVKKLFSVMLGFLLLATPIMAANVQPGAETEIVFNKEVELDNLGIDADYSAQNYDLTLKTTFGDWLTVTPKAGLSTVQYENDSDFAADVEVKSGIGWNIGIDAEAKLYTLNVKDNYIFDVSAIGGYQFSRVDIDEFEISGVTIDNPIEAIVYTHEYEVGGKISRDLNDLGVPVNAYVGLVYSDLIGSAELNTSAIVGTDLEEDIEAKDNIGIRAGIIGKPIKDLYVGLEGKFVDETALIASVSYRF